MAKRKEGIQGKVLNLLMFSEKFCCSSTISTNKQYTPKFLTNSAENGFGVPEDSFFFHLSEIRQFLRSYLEQKAVAEIYNENIVIKRL